MKTPIAFDLETPLITHEDPYPLPVVVVVSTRTSTHLSKDVEGTMRPLLTAAAAGEIVLVGHNVAFDMGCLLTHYPDLAPLVWDAYEADGVVCTLLREQLIDIAEGERRRDVTEAGGPYSLGRVADRRLGVKLDKGADSWRLRYAELVDVPLSDWPEAATRYVEADGENTLALYHDQERRRGSYELPTQYLEARADFALSLTTSWGFLVDAQAVDKFDADIEVQRCALGAQLARAGYLRADPKNATDLFGHTPRPKWIKNTKVVQEMVEQLWDGTGQLPRTATGLVKTDKDTLMDCVGGDSDLLRDYSSVESTGSRFLKALRPLRGRATRSRFYPLGADSSRTSSSGPNLQQLPRKPGARECFVARPGTALLACDFDGQETRTWAQSCLDIIGSSAIADRFAADPDYDAHTDLVCHQLGISYAEGRRLRAAGDDVFETARGNVKPATFGFPVGMGAKTFRVFARNQGVDLTLTQCEELKAVFYAARPETRPYLDHVSAVVGAASYGTQLQPQSGFRRGGVGFTDCANGYFQTLAAHASKEGFWRVVRRCYDARCNSYLLGSRPVNFVHDEGIVETPLEVLHEAGEAIVSEMETGMQAWLKDVPARAGVTASTVWSKKAKERRDDNGRLVPWEPE